MMLKMLATLKLATLKMCVERLPDGALPPDGAVLQAQEAEAMIPEYVNPLQWNEAMGVARQSCARVFRDGGAPIDALKAFGLDRRQGDAAGLTWDKAVTEVAEALCAKPVRRAA